MVSRSSKRSIELELELEAAAAAAGKRNKICDGCGTVEHSQASLREDAFSNRVLVQPLQPWQPLTGGFEVGF